MSPPKPLLLYHTGRAPEAIAAEHGGFSDWFGRLLAGHELEVTEHDGVEPSAPPDPRDFAGIVLTGSPASVTAPEHWMEGAVETIREAHRFGTPLLGVCFGHQLIGAAYGATVVGNPLGWEVASHDIEVDEAGRTDPLFEGLFDADNGGKLSVNFSHRDAVAADTVSPLNGLRILAGNAKCATQVLAASDHIRGVQFHPEFTGSVVSAYVRHRYDEIAADADGRTAPADHPKQLLESARDCPDGERVFHNFVRNFVRKS